MASPSSKTKQQILYSGVSMFQAWFFCGLISWGGQSEVWLCFVNLYQPSPVAPPQPLRGAKSKSRISTTSECGIRPPLTATYGKGRACVWSALGASILADGRSPGPSGRGVPRWGGGERAAPGYGAARGWVRPRIWRRRRWRLRDRALHMPRNVLCVVRPQPLQQAEKPRLEASTDGVPTLRVTPQNGAEEGVVEALNSSPPPVHRAPLALRIVCHRGHVVCIHPHQRFRCPLCYLSPRRQSRPLVGRRLRGRLRGRRRWWVRGRRRWWVRGRRRGRLRRRLWRRVLRARVLRG